MPRTSVHARRQRLVRAADHYLDDCYRRSTAARVSEFASFLGVTPPYLSRLASEIFGIPLRDFLRARQLARAVRLLRATPLPMWEIAIRCGFGTTATFYRWFRGAYDMTPGAYREVVK